MPQLTGRHHRLDLKALPGPADATPDAVSTMELGHATRCLGIVFGAAVVTFVLSGALARPADAATLPAGLVSAIGPIAPSGVVSDVTAIGTPHLVSTVANAAPIPSEVSNTPVGAVVATLSNGVVAKQVGTGDTAGPGGDTAHNGVGPTTSTPGSGHQSPTPITGSHDRTGNQTNHSGDGDDGTAVVPVSLTGISPLPPLSLPTARWNATISPTHGNGPFDGLPPTILLVPVLIIGALAYARRRSKRFLHRSRWAPPG